MINYVDLTNAQKKYVALVQMFFPEVKTEVTWEQVHSMHAFFLEKRKEDKRYKVGLPHWFTGPNLLRRGVYHFPAEKNYLEGKMKVITEIEAEYKDELIEYGIEERF